MFGIGFLVGMLVGCLIGIMITSLCCASRINDIDSIYEFESDVREDDIK